MSRQRTIDKVQLFQETEKLILENGYHSFHFKALAERLNVARSTIYNYYSKKEELVTDYMMHVIDTLMTRLNELETEIEFESKLIKVIQIWVEYSDIHQALQILPVLDHHASPLVEANVQKLFGFFQELNERVERLINEGQQLELLRRDIPVTGLSGIIMAMVKAPNTRLSKQEWVSAIYNVLMNGMAK
ncbi:TetR/AcrR family transcriptional regulator [Alteribacillus sp. HJP-4]|uniref:TetR/AcrR family transcriptional regulator n=1 Tax=Alteribacillus sp. HJP-4 TaxID=2775394 RepID=UPI0035CD2C5D